MKFFSSLYRLFLTLLRVGTLVSLILVGDALWFQTSLFSGFRSKTRTVISRFQMLQTTSGLKDLFHQSKSLWDTEWNPEVAVTPIVDSAVLSRINLDIPTTAIYLVKGDILYGEIIEEKEKSISFNRRLGHSGSIQQWISRENIKSIRTHTLPKPQVNLYEMELANLLPEFHIYQDATSTLFTDADYFVIEQYQKLLGDLEARLPEALPELFPEKLHRFRRMVLIFKNESGYFDYLKQETGQHQKGSGAVYLWHNNCLAFFLEKESGESRRSNRNQLLRHEATHQFFANYFYMTNRNNVFLWFNEGLAEYCSPMWIGNPLVQHTRGIKRISIDETFNWEAFFNEREGWQSLDIHQAYTLAWASVSVAMNHYRENFMKYLQVLRSKKGAIPSEAHEQIFQESFHMTYQDFFNSVPGYFS